MKLAPPRAQDHRGISAPPPPAPASKSPVQVTQLAPTVSVIVASVGGSDLAVRSIRALVTDCQRLGAEIVIARSGTAAELGPLRAAFPMVRWIAAPASATVQELRAMGMAQCTGDVVVLAHDPAAVDVAGVAALVRDRTESRMEVV